MNDETPALPATLPTLLVLFVEFVAAVVAPWRKRKEGVWQQARGAGLSCFFRIKLYW
jgi:hypothetical protein